MSSYVGMRIHVVMLSCFAAACGAHTARPPLPNGQRAVVHAPETAAIAAAAPTEPPAPPFRLPCGESDLVECTNACHDGVREDCVTLGSMYMEGAVVSIDHERAIGLFRDAGTSGSARACIRLGDVYHAGILSDLTEETRLYRQACDAGANLGCVSAGRAYLEGRGVGRDPVFGASLFMRVCERGNATACFELGRLYDHGEGVPRDANKAFELYSKACKLGHDQGCLLASKTEEVLPPRN